MTGKRISAERLRELYADYAEAGHDLETLFAPGGAYQCCRCGADQIDLSEDQMYGPMRKCSTAQGDRSPKGQDAQRLDAQHESPVGRKADAPEPGHDEGGEFSVSRYYIRGGDPDRLQVCRGNKVLLDVRMGPEGPLHPETAEAAKLRPWFFTGSPFGREILELARERGVIS